MDLTFRLIHVLGAIAVGYYIIMPFLLSRIDKIPANQQSGYVKVLHTFNRIGQYILILQFITGGYLISKKPYTIAWMVIIIVVFVLLAALAGMMGKPLKRIIETAGTDAGNDSDIQPMVSRLTLFSTFICICFLVLVILMAFPWIK